MSRDDETQMLPPVAQALVGFETLAASKSLSYPAGTILFREHEPDDRLYVILSGQIALISQLGTNHEQVAVVRGSGEIIGETGFFQPEHIHQFGGRVLVDTEVLVLERSELDDVLRREPLLAYELLRFASSLLQWSHERAMRDMQDKNAQLTESYAALQAAQAKLLQQERIEHELRLAHQIVDHELHLAREIQEGMLPRVLPVVDGINLGARSIPAHEVGGDFFDVFALDDETLGVMIGDVVGKGMPAALHMAQTRVLIRGEAHQSSSPEVVLRRVNEALRALNTGDMFVTVLFGRLHHATRTLITARAGHEYPLVWAAHGSELVGERAVGQPLGILPDPVLDVQTRTLLPGDTLVLYTDGVTDTVNPAGAFFAQDGLHEAMRSARATTAQEMCDHIVQRVATFQGTAQQLDDITLVVVQAY